MLIGDKNRFAIESEVTIAFEEDFKALGFFVVYVGGYSYGIRSSDATPMEVVYGEVKNHIKWRGTHTAPFAKADAGTIANAVRDAVYAPDQEQNHFFGISHPHFRKMVYDKQLLWVVDEAFDDSSYLLQFDVGNQVRLIAFKSRANNGEYHHDPATLHDVLLLTEYFYDILQRWQKAFELEWTNAPKSK